MSITLNNKIRKLREMNNWSQEKMAEQINVSKNTYGKLERGESRLTVEHLDKISQVFDMDIIELINLTDKGLVCLFSENNTQYGNFYQSSDSLISENEKLQLLLKHSHEMMQQKDNEIKALKEVIELLKQNGKCEISE